MKTTITLSSGVKVDARPAPQRPAVALAKRVMQPAPADPGLYAAHTGRVINALRPYLSVAVDWPAMPGIRADLQANGITPPRDDVTCYLVGCIALRATDKGDLGKLGDAVISPGLKAAMRGKR
jgi:hypothetical protein